MDPVTAVTGVSATDSASAGGLEGEPRLAPGQDFGPYRIERLLGRGGMGEVYEATRVDQTRRVAIKVISQRLTGAADRARFLHEGELAASISHPNSVYIFGSDEIDGIPVIEMELSRGGTLKDRVERDGPMPYVLAVDAIRQVIAGLDAAQAAGVLHRDVKPSNCFVDDSGRVRIGDFGLSMSTVAREAPGVEPGYRFQGTPQFASPEQLRGEPQDTRSDLYAVGATLFYLLTGRPPADGRTLGSSVPRGLAKIVRRCLSRDRAQRPATYAALDDGLRPFGPQSPAPSSVGLRALAGFIDLTMFQVSIAAARLLRAAPRSSGRAHFDWWSDVAPAVVGILYFGLLEGLWGTTVGKRLCGLQVIRRDGLRPGLGLAFGRAAIFEATKVATALISLIWGPAMPSGSGWIVLASVIFAVGWVGLFATMVRGNGYAAVHDLITGTRVVQRFARARSAAVSTQAPDTTAADAKVIDHLGPFDVLAPAGQTDRGDLFDAVDRRLRRPVWIHRLASGSPALSPAVHEADRPTALRWLGEGRSADAAWDAFEAPGGGSLQSRLRTPQSWDTVKHWLLDLATELKARLHDRSVEPFSIDRVWIDRGGRARLLDFAAPDDRSQSRGFNSPQSFLAHVATESLVSPSRDGGATVLPADLPLSARTMVDRLSRDGFASLADVVAEARGVAEAPSRLTRLRRAAHLAVVASPVLFSAVTIAIMMTTTDRAKPKDYDALVSDLQLLKDQERGRPYSYISEADENALSVYISGRFGQTLADDATWKNPSTANDLEPLHETARRVLNDHPRPTTEETAAARRKIAEHLRLRESEPIGLIHTVLIDAGTSMQMMLAPLAWLSALIVPGGLLLRLFGIAVVTGNGREASRVRSLWRATIAWLPFLAAWVVWIAFVKGGTGPFAMSIVMSGLLLDGPTYALLILTAGAVWAIAGPARGIQDWLSGTRLVVR